MGTAVQPGGHSEQPTGSHLRRSSLLSCAVKWVRKRLGYEPSSSQSESTVQPPSVRCGRAGLGRGRLATLMPPIWSGACAESATACLHMVELTPLDLVPVVFNTVVAVTCVLHGPTDAAIRPDIVVRCLQQAVQHVQRLYPLVTGRLLPFNKAQRAVGQSVGSSKNRSSHALVYSSLGNSIQPFGIMSGGAQAAVAAPHNSKKYGVTFGVPIIAVQLPDMTPQAVQHAVLARSGYGYADSCQHALPAFCQAIDVGAMHAGKEPLLKLQVSYVGAGGPRGTSCPHPAASTGCVLLGITVSHILADAATLSILSTELCQAYHAALCSHNVVPHPGPDVRPDAVQCSAACSRVTQQPAQTQAPPLQQSWVRATGQQCESVATVQGKPPADVVVIEVRRTPTPIVPVHAVATDDSPPSTGILGMANGHGGLLHSGTSAGWSVHTNPGSMPEACDITPTSPGKHASTSRYDRSSLQYSSTDQHLALSASSERYFQSVFIPLKPSGVVEACKAGSALLSGLCAELRVLGWRALVGPTTLVLHVRKCDLDALKAACQTHADRGNDSTSKLSSHDICAGLLWLVCASLRGRPLPGQPLDSKFASSTAWGRQLQDRMFGVTLDLRRNCKPSRVLEDHLGNASASLHVRHQDGDANLKFTPSVPWPCSWQPGAAADVTAAWLSHLANDATLNSKDTAQHVAAQRALTSVVAGAAMRVRAAVNTFRSLPETADVVVAEFEAHAKASLMENACVLGRYVAQFDGFLSSWSSFPNMRAAQQLLAPALSSTKDETCSTTTLQVLQPIIHNLAPWTALAITAPSLGQPCPAVDDLAVHHNCTMGRSGHQEGLVASPDVGLHAEQNAAMGSAAACCKEEKSDGLLLYFTVPAAAANKLQESRLVSALLPNSRWLSA